MNQITDTSSFALLAGEAGFDPIEERLRTNVRATIEAVVEEELASFLGRLRYDRGVGSASYAGIWVTRPDQAARFSAALWATPSVNVTPSMTKGNWLAPLRRRHVLAAA